MKSKNAFTFVETSLVIFFIITLTCAIFFTKKILKENDIKSLAMQIKKYDVALNSFTQKYHALPGDLRGSQDYGITENNTDGNDDNVISDRNKKILQANGEITNFWLHLSNAKMLDEIFDGAANEKVKIGSTFPISKIGEKVGIIAFGAEGKTFYQIGFNFADSDRIHTSNRSLKTDEAFLFDQKIDDGHAQKGRVVAAGGNVLNSLENEECVKFGEYSESNPDTVCQLRIEAK